MSGKLAADRLPAVQAFFADRGTGAERNLTALVSLANWIAGGTEQGQRSYKVSDDGVHADKLRWSVELTNKVESGERGERVYGTSMGDALAQAAMVVESDPGLEADLEACGE